MHVAVRRTATRTVLLGALWCGWWGQPAHGTVAPQYVTSRVCAECHAAQLDAWRGSHHAQAMQEANAQTVLGNFGGARFSYAGVTSTFFTRAGKFFVNTDGPDGTLADYEVKYAFGVAPLQQYLVAFPDGRVQALGIAWDARRKAAGGQRWFHLYPGERVDFRDVLHWTGPAQNWNFMCAECHSTDVRKHYDAARDRFATSWAEINVACEACHGPGSAHVEWARRTKEERAADNAAKGLTVDLVARGGTWALGSDPIAHLTGARDTRAQAVCARCHARRAQLGEDYDGSQPLEQAYMMALLEEGLYHADGQILDEVFEYGSFLQSAMHERGVMCADCHDPHSGKLRAAGNAVCAPCHQPAHYDAPAHHHHQAGTAAAQCAKCHMPSRTYMVVHERHDHSFRVPRPDLSVSLGTPNPCTDCHQGRLPQWAADAVVNWYGPTRQRGPRYAAALAAGRTHQAGAERLLAEVIGDRSFPAIVRATALRLLENFPGAAPELIERSLHAQEDPLVRRAALSPLTSWPPERRWKAGVPLLDDPLRAIRIAAVGVLADVPATRSLSAEHRAAFDRAAAEYRAMQAFNADRAEAWFNLGQLDARLGNVAPAEAAYRRAIRRQPWFIPSYVNLADLYRQHGRDPDGERVLREALARQPPNGDVHHALGLLLVRERRLDEAVGALGEAATRSPDNPRYTYVYAVALHSAGQPEQALAVLADAQRRFSGDRDILAALAQWSAERGDVDAAARWAAQLRALDR
jgi:tetratricopeptide (TPR) repeat protein